MVDKTLDGKFVVEDDQVTIKRKGICRGGRISGREYLEPWIQHPERVRVIVDEKGYEANISIGPNNKDIFYAAKQAGYEEGEPFEYEIIVKKKE